jgi:hypothetical protein
VPELKRFVALVRNAFVEFATTVDVKLTALA